MPRYRYRAVNLTGEIVEDEMEAAAQSAVVEWLQERGYFPLEAAAATDRRNPGNLATGNFGLKRRGVSRKALTLLTRELATLLRAGLPLERALTILSDLSKNDAAGELLDRVLERLRGGSSFADALAEERRSFPPLYIGLVRAGEAGGALETSLARLADHLERSQALADRLSAALLYPALLVVMTLLSTIILMTVVVPEFQAMFEEAGSALPLPTQIIVKISEALTSYGWAIGLGAIGLFWLLRRQLQSSGFRFWWDGMLLKMPLFGDLLCKVEVARFSRTLATLVENGVALLSSLAIVKDTLGNRALIGAVSAAADQLREGKGLAAPLAETGLFPDLAVQLLKVGEETGDLEQMLMHLSQIYDEEVQVAVDRFVALLVPLITIILGLVIAFIIGSVMLAFLSVNELAF
ncbi:MAG: type II secretion system F family protein [Kiloniellales bacterium]|nr:type II secretion system F family protein [Kiloniellales bacterium]